MPRKPQQIPERLPLTAEQIAAARYTGSPEHKDQRWWGGLPQAFIDRDGVARRPGKQDTTVCPLRTEAERDEATGWVQIALSSGQFRYYEGDKDYPKKIWYLDSSSRPSKIWLGQCINSVRGEYKGWPIDEDEKREVFG
jgi:hypothetical protein